jgi:hypothetical protein
MQRRECRREVIELELPLPSAYRNDAVKFFVHSYLERVRWLSNSRIVLSISPNRSDVLRDGLTRQ